MSTCESFYPQYPKKSSTNMSWPRSRTTAGYILKFKREWLAWIRQEKLPMTSWKTSGRIWLWTNVPHPWYVETRLPRHFQYHSVWFQGKVHIQTRCRAPQKLPANIIPHDHTLDRIKKLGLTLKWDYINRTVDLSMPNYEFQNKTSDKPKDSPRHWYRLP